MWEIGTWYVFSWIPKISLKLSIHEFDWWALSSFLIGGVKAHEDIGSVVVMRHHRSGRLLDHVMHSPYLASFHTCGRDMGVLTHILLNHFLGVPWFLEINGWYLFMVSLLYTWFLLTNYYYCESHHLLSYEPHLTTCVGGPCTWINVICTHVEVTLCLRSYFNN